jgi:hypothetical protein
MRKLEVQAVDLILCTDLLACWCQVTLELKQVFVDDSMFFEGPRDERMTGGNISVRILVDQVSLNLAGAYEYQQEFLKFIMTNIPSSP